MRRRLGETVDAELRLREHGQRLTVEIIEEPRLAGQQRARMLVPLGLDFCLGAFDDQKGVGVRVAPRRGEQRLGGMPRTPGQAQRIRAIGCGMIRWSGGLGPAR